MRMNENRDSWVIGVKRKIGEEGGVKEANGKVEKSVARLESDSSICC